MTFLEGLLIGFMIGAYFGFKGGQQKAEKKQLKLVGK